MADGLGGAGRDVPSPARMYDYYLGGTDNFPADREAAEAVIAAQPQAPRIARNNRAFLVRAVELVVAQGVDQILDVGSGVPTSPNVHEILRAAHPHGHVVYVDNDPVVLAHDRALLDGDERVSVVDGDLLDPDAILDDPRVRAAIDFDRPVAVLLVAVMHFSRELAPEALVAPFRDRMAPGSYLVASHVTTEGMTEPEIEAFVAPYRRTPRGARMRSREEIAPMFDGFELLEPGLVDVAEWRGSEPPTDVRCLAGVGHRA